MTPPSLTAAQTRVLLGIYSVDQETEAYQRRAFTRGHHCRSASEWRWLPYVSGWLLTSQCGSRAETHFRALAVLGLVELAEKRLPEYPESRTEYLHVRLTRQGRATARALSGATPTPRLPVGTLRDWQWAALVKAWEAGMEGLEDDGVGRYGGIPWRTWLRLRDYRTGALIEQFLPPAPRGLDPHRLRLTDHGRAFYATHWEHYLALYPHVPAPALEGVPVPVNATQRNSRLR